MYKVPSLWQINVALKETDALTIKTLHKQKKPSSFCQSLLSYANLLSILIRPCFFPPRAASHPKPCLINIDAHSICLPVAPLFSFVGGTGAGFHSTWSWYTLLAFTVPVLWYTLLLSALPAMPSQKSILIRKTHRPKLSLILQGMGW